MAGIKTNFVRGPATVSAIAFDKTRTLTTGQLQLKQVIPCSNTTKAELLQIAASLEAYSENPIGDAILQAAEAENMSLLGAIAVQAKVGQGIIGQIAGKSVTVGKKTFVLTEEIELDRARQEGRSLRDIEAESEQLEAQGCSVI